MVIHPVNHYDVNYENSSTYKVGLNNKIGMDEFIDLLNVETDCHFLSKCR